MSSGLVLCHEFLVVIFVIFHAQALKPGPWKTVPGQGCYWKLFNDGSRDSYELIQRFPVSSNLSYASVFTSYGDLLLEGVPGRFCIRYSVNGLLNREILILVINSGQFEIRAGQSLEQCVIVHSKSKPIKVSFNATSCAYLSRPIVTIEGANIVAVSSSTIPTSNGDPTSETVGDIQYVGVVVGAICIALFTLFSCLTIISARRSNQRDSRRRTLPSASCQEEDDNRPDVVADNAPPSYDAVMACPDLYPPTPQETPHGTPETTPHLSLHRRALLNQHGSLPGSGSGTPQLHRQSFTPTIASDEWDEIPEYPPPPYPGLANGDVSTAIPEDATDNTTEVENASGEMPSIENPGVSHPGSENSGELTPNHDSSPVEENENPWILNNIGNSYLRNRDDNSPGRGNTEQYPMRTRTPSHDSTHSNQDSQAESMSSSDGPVIDTTSESAQDRSPKPMVESGTHIPELRIAVV